jgi:membrane-associated phospholipid phosphatase
MVKKLVTAILLLSTATAQAEDTNHSPYEVNLVLDLGITIGGLTICGLPRLFVEEYIEPACGLDCDPDDVNALDRTVIGNYSETAVTISDFGAGAAWVLPHLLGAIDVLVTSPSDGWTGYGKDALVIIETLSVTLAANNLLNFLVLRPRPLVYDENVSDDHRLMGDSALSFPSGHTAGAFAMATAYSRLFMLRHPDSPMVIPMWIGTYALATTTGVLRTTGGDHFWTDVIAGAVMGVGFGLLIPWLHERKKSSGVALGPLVTPDGGFGAVLTVW